MEKQPYPCVTDPGAPETPGEKLYLLRRCQTTLEAGGTVEGITPQHVTQEGMYLLTLMKRAQQSRLSGL